MTGSARRVALFGGLVVMALTAVGCGGGRTTPTAVRAVSVSLTEFTISATPVTVDHGLVTFTVRNEGTTSHEMVILRTDLPADQLPVADSKASEEGAGISSPGEIDEFAAGTTQTKSFDLAAGRYVLICNIPEHYGKGMRATIDVR